MAESKLAVLAALVGNFLIAVAKLVGGFIANSAAMFAEAAHSFSDVGNQALLLLGMRRSKRPPDERYPFGTGKAAYFWPFMVAVILFGGAGTFSLFEGIEKVRHPHAVDDIRISLIVLGLAFVIEAIVLGVAVKQARAKARQQGLSARAFLGENRDASLLTILVEDTVALIGLPMAAAGLVASKITGNGVWDGTASVAIGVLLMGFALFLGSNVRGLLIGRALSSADLRLVRKLVDDDPDIDSLVRVQSMHLGPDAALLAADVVFRQGLSASQAAASIDALEARMAAALPALKHVYLEPELAPALMSGAALPDA